MNISFGEAEISLAKGIALLAVCAILLYLAWKQHKDERREATKVVSSSLAVKSIVDRDVVSGAAHYLGQRPISTDSKSISSLAKAPYRPSVPPRRSDDTFLHGAIVGVVAASLMSPSSSQGAGSREPDNPGSCAPHAAEPDDRVSASESSGLSATEDS